MSRGRYTGPQEKVVARAVSVVMPSHLFPQFNFSPGQIGWAWRSDKMHTFSSSPEAPSVEISRPFPFDVTVIFEPFFSDEAMDEDKQYEASQRLSFPYFIITQHHRGKMAITSNVDIGTTFHLELPLE